MTPYSLTARVAALLASRPPSWPVHPLPANDGALARMIDHTLLRPDATPEAVETLCAEARQHGFASVCVAPLHVRDTARLLHGSGVRVCTVIGFPLGAAATATKGFEASRALLDGAGELDMVLQVGLLKAGRTAEVLEDIRTVTGVARTAGAVTKVILETALLTDEEKVVACLLAREAGADFVKTSSGFAPSGATTADVALLRHAVGTAMGVKASGGIRTREAALTMIVHGASRLGTSAGVAILQNRATAAKGG
jgi:deoxyribose-phosphate aldolase